MSTRTETARLTKTKSGNGYIAVFDVVVGEEEVRVDIPQTFIEALAQKATINKTKRATSSVHSGQLWNMGVARARVLG